MKKLKTIPLTHEERVKMEKDWNENFMLKNLGVKIDLSHDEEVKAVIDPVQPFHRGGLGTDAVNGVIISGLFDLIIGLVGIVNSNNHRTGTVQLNINFLRPLKGNKIIMSGKLTKKGKLLVFARAEIYDENENICAACDGITSIDYNSPPIDNYIAI